MLLIETDTVNPGGKLRLCRHVINRGIKITTYKHKGKTIAFVVLIHSQHNVTLHSQRA